MIRKLLVICSIFSVTLSIGQDHDLPFGHILLDSVVITAVKQGLDIEDLIDIMQYDSTFYIAFNNLHFTGCSILHEMEVQNRKGKKIAAKKIDVRQKYEDACRSQYESEVYTEGKLVNKKGEELYYTAHLFERTFYMDDKVCGEKRKSNWRDVVYGSKSDGHLAAIKRVIFNPGTPVDLPLIGNKFALFKPEMQAYYHYKIERKEVNGYDCFVFSVSARPEFQASRKDIVVRSLSTAFQRSDFQIIKRDYHLEYNGLLVNLDIQMDVDLTLSGDRYYPSKITYEGYWKVPARRAERISFNTTFDY